jgi:hypothetical protein
VHVEDKIAGQTLPFGLLPVRPEHRSCEMCPVPVERRQGAIDARYL